MNNKILTAGAVFGALMLPVAAYAQSGVAAGATTGAVGGAIVGGPVGAVVGGVGGAVVGGISDANQQSRFNTYVVEQNTPSYTYSSEVAVGAELPEAGVTYYDVPAEYGTQYRYTVVNKRTVLVDPRTRRVVQVIR
jgi:hypothetical protein